MAIETINIMPAVLRGEPMRFEGDAELWGAPNFRAHIWLENRDKSIVLVVSADWEEPKPDWSKFRYETRRIIYDIGKKGPQWRFVDFKERYDLVLDWTSIPGTNQGLQEMYRSNSGLINVLRAEGDSYGGWFGGADRPKIEITFNRVYFDVTDA